MEQVIDWLNENELRAYPLMDTPSKTLDFDGVSWVLRDDCVLDLQLRAPFSLKQTIQTSSGDVDGYNPVLLKTVSYNRVDDINTVQLVFGTAENTIATFNLEDAERLNYPHYIRTEEGCLLVVGAGILELITTAPVNSTALANIAVEPSVCIQFNDAWLGVSSLRTSPEKNSKDPNISSVYDCFEPALPVENSETTHSLVGDVKLLAGYNFRVDIAKNLIDLEVNASYGLIMNCNTSFIPERYLDCTELVSYINGVPPDDAGNYRLNPGSNIMITPGTTLPTFEDTFTEEANKYSLFIGLTFKATDLCAPVNIIPV